MRKFDFSMLLIPDEKSGKQIYSLDLYNKRVIKKTLRLYFETIISYYIRLTFVLMTGMYSEVDSTPLII